MESTKQQVYIVFVQRNAASLPSGQRRVKYNVKSKTFGVSGECERCKETALLLAVRICICRLQFVPLALFAVDK